MRSKEQAHDYCYFPELDLVPMVISREWVEEVRQTLPELPDAGGSVLCRSSGFQAYDAALLTGTKALADYSRVVSPNMATPK